MPIVLLGIRSAIKEDIGGTSAELVYGTTLRLPGSYFSPATHNLDPSDYVNNLKATMQGLRAVPPCESSTRIVHVPYDLFTQTHVFVRHDASRKPLQSPYDGPYKVISRTKKNTLLSISKASMKSSRLTDSRVLTSSQILLCHP